MPPDATSSRTLQGGSLAGCFRFQAYERASVGNGTFDGGAGTDVLYVHFGPALTGTLKAAVQDADHATISVDGTVIFNITRTDADTYVLEGVAGTAGAAYGRETVSNIEEIFVMHNSEVGGIELTGSAPVVMTF